MERPGFVTFKLCAFKEPSWARLTESAVFKTQGTIESLKRDAATLVSQAPASETGPLAALEAAIRALEEFHLFLRDDSRTTRPATALTP